LDDKRLKPFGRPGDIEEEAGFVEKEATATADEAEDKEEVVVAPSAASEEIKKGLEELEKLLEDVKPAGVEEDKRLRKRST
jgi:hypothetical protein